MKKVRICISESCERYRQDIKRFVDAMLFKLGKNTSRGRWEDVDLDTALSKLHGEVEELHNAINEEGCNVVEVLLECADVANYAMIIASIVIERKQKNGNRSRRRADNGV